MKVLDIIGTILLIIGALNWGLIGFFGYNLIEILFGEATVATAFIYGLIGIGGLYEVGCFTFGLRKTHERWCETLAVVKH